MANPRIEEVDDDIADDPEEMDVDAFDFARPQGTLGQTATNDSASQMPADMMEALMQTQKQHGSTGFTAAPQTPRMSAQERERYQREAQEKSKDYQCIYPLYFDSTRSREQGRRVPKDQAVPNPLAREIVEALSVIGSTLQVPLQIVLEPTKTHPKDWANPGRVKVLIKKEGSAVSSKIRNSKCNMTCSDGKEEHSESVGKLVWTWLIPVQEQYLFRLISEWLKTHPTTEDTPRKLQIQGVPMPKEKMPPPAVPRGSKIGSILPLHSPALSGGGVSENMFKDMMAEMGGQLPGMPPMGASEPPQKKVKDKKKK